MTYLPIIAEIKYIELIYNAEQENRKKGDGNYYEKHHITPKCFGGTNDVSNLVLLSPREHFEAHQLLCDMYQDDKKKYHQMLCAMHRMVYGHKKHYENEITIEEYEELKIELSKANSEKMKGKTYAKGVKHTEAQNKAQSERMKGHTINKGKKHTEEWKKANSERMKGNTYGKGAIHTTERNKAKSDRMKGKKRSPQCILKRRITCAKKRLSENKYPNKSGFTHESDLELIRNYESLET